VSFTPIRSGYTGPSAKIGGSTDYHIDLKLLESLPIAQRVQALDSLARQYQSIGREIEFSNPSVAGARWNPSLDLSDKVDLLNKAAAAHSHSSHPGWQSVDFYVPFKGKSRFEPGAVEGASIYIPGVAGGKVRRSTGEGYGYFSEATDPSGQVVFRVGHGDISRPEETAEVAVAPGTQPDTAGTQEQDKAYEYLGEALGKVLADAVLGNSKGYKAEAPKAEEPKDYVSKSDLKELLAERDAARRAEAIEQQKRKGVEEFVSNVERTKRRMMEASLSAMKAFKSPSSLV